MITSFVFSDFFPVRSVPDDALQKTNDLVIIKTAGFLVMMVSTARIRTSREDMRLPKGRYCWKQWRPWVRVVVHGEVNDFISRRHLIFY